MAYSTILPGPRVGQLLLTAIVVSCTKIVLEPEIKLPRAQTGCEWQACGVD